MPCALHCIFTGGEGCDYESSAPWKIRRVYVTCVACAGRGECVDALPYAYLHRQAGVRVHRPVAAGR